jgi:hypothetical protein
MPQTAAKRKRKGKMRQSHKRGVSEQGSESEGMAALSANLPGFDVIGIPTGRSHARRAVRRTAITFGDEPHE